MRILGYLIVVGLLSSAVPAWAETAPGSLTVSVLVVDRCVVSNAAASNAIVKCEAAAPPYRVTDEIKALAGSDEKAGRTVTF